MMAPVMLVHHHRQRGCAGPVNHDIAKQVPQERLPGQPCSDCTPKLIKTFLSVSCRGFGCAMREQLLRSYNSDVTIAAAAVHSTLRSPCTSAIQILLSQLRHT
jgi:hypothetical protein